MTIPEYVKTAVADTVLGLLTLLCDGERAEGCLCAGIIGAGIHVTVFVADAETSEAIKELLDNNARLKKKLDSPRMEIIKPS